MSAAAKMMPLTPDSPETKAAVERYQAKYQAVEATFTRADNLGYGSTFVAGIVFIATLLIYQSTRSERAGFPVISLSLIAASVLIVLGAQLWSMFVRKQGQQRLDALKTEVNASPVLSEMQRARILHLPSARPGQVEKTTAA